MTSLFDTLEQEAGGPLADRLRPQDLAEVVGQEHGLSEDGYLRRVRGWGQWWLSGGESGFGAIKRTEFLGAAWMW